MNRSAAVPLRACWIALSLGTVCTGSSIAITVMAGRDRGGTVAEQIIWIGVGMALLLGAHLLPAVASAAKPAARVFASFLWVGAMMSTGYTHGTFFLAAQQRAGDNRAAQEHIPSVIPDQGAASRNTTILLGQQAKLAAALGQLTLTRCVENCRALTVRRQTLRSQLEAVRGQLGEARRQEQAADRREMERAQALARQDARRSDPVSTKISAISGVPSGTINLGIALFLGWLLEGIACFCWYLALSGLRRVGVGVCDKASGEPLPTAGAAGVVSSAPAVVSFKAREPAANDPVSRNNPSDAVDLSAEDELTEEPHATFADMPELDQESRLRHALAAGDATGSISEIVQLLGCTEGRALALRRQIAVTDPHLLVASKRLVG